jgi:hypothetical protein
MFTSSVGAKTGLRALLKLVVFGSHSNQFTTDELIYVQDAAPSITEQTKANSELVQVPQLKKRNRARIRAKLDSIRQKFRKR